MERYSCKVCGKVYRPVYSEILGKTIYSVNCKCHTLRSDKIKPLDKAFIELDKLLTKNRGKK